MSLHAKIGIVFLGFLLALKPDPGPVPTDAHVALGIGTRWRWPTGTSRAPRTTPPARFERVASASASLALPAALVGRAVQSEVGSSASVRPGRSRWDLRTVFHVVLGVAIMTQSAAVAIAFYMGENREFEPETTPGGDPAAGPASFRGLDSPSHGPPPRLAIRPCPRVRSGRSTARPHGGAAPKRLLGEFLVRRNLAEIGGAP